MKKILFFILISTLLGLLLGCQGILPTNTGSSADAAGASAQTGTSMPSAADTESPEGESSPESSSEVDRDALIIAIKSHLEDSPEAFATFIQQIKALTPEQKDKLIAAQAVIRKDEPKRQAMIDSLLTPADKEALHKMDMDSDAYKAANAKINQALKDNKELADLSREEETATKEINQIMAGG